MDLSNLELKGLSLEELENRISALYLLDQDSSSPKASW